jgi:hypothetical protein
MRGSKVRAGYRLLTSCIAATAGIYIAHLIRIAPISYVPLLAVISAVVGVATDRIYLSSSAALAYVSLMVLLTSILSWQSVSFDSFPLSPFSYFLSFFSPYSGYISEVFVFAIMIAVSLLGGAAGSLLNKGVLLVTNYGGSDTARDEIAGLKERLGSLETERKKLEEELRVCEIIEQGAKTRIARNELSQNDYEAIIRSNEAYKDKLKGRYEEIQVEMNRLRLDIEARMKAREERKLTTGAANK